MAFSHFREKAADHQKDVDGHLMFSYMSEANGWKKEVERLDKGKKTFLYNTVTLYSILTFCEKITI
jgi:hypothetical protein